MLIDLRLLVLQKVTWRILSVILDCEKFIAQSEDLSLISRTYRSNMSHAKVSLLRLEALPTQKIPATCEIVLS